MNVRKIPIEKRVCTYPDCWSIFVCRVDSKQKFCSCACANKFNSFQKWICEKRSRSAKKRWQDTEACRKQSQTMKKVWEDSEYRKNHSQSTKEVWEDPEYKYRTREAMKKAHSTPEAKENHRQAAKKNWQDPEYREKVLKAVFGSSKTKPNKPEKLLNNLLQKLLPNEYKYVGDGEFILAGRCPDFINVNGQKKIIELFGDYWHSEEIQGVSKKQHVQERKDFFNRYGYETLIIWEHELENIEEVGNKTLEFNKM